MREFWDNSQEHKDDIVNFIHGRKQHYFYGTTKYWVGYIAKQPFCFILTDEILSTKNDLTDVHKAYLSKTGHTIALNFGIGNTAFLNKGLAASTLRNFTEFYQKDFDQKAHTFFIDPDENNSRAFHVYAKAGFKLVGSYATQEGFFKGQGTCLMVKELFSS